MTGDIVNEYRLRQIALVSDDCDRVAGDLEKVFGVKVAFRDPDIIHYGLRNVVIPMGQDFIEVVEPVQDDASAGRYLARRGGEGGYMVILQAEDAIAHRERLTALGAAIVDVLDNDRHECTHFHPAVFGGVLASIDSAPHIDNWKERFSDWFPVGQDWRDKIAPGIRGIAAIDLKSEDKQALAERWGTLLDLPVENGATPSIAVIDARIRFVDATDGYPLGIDAIAIALDDPEAAFDRARAAGLPVGADAITIGGVLFRPVAAA